MGLAEQMLKTDWGSPQATCAGCRYFEMPKALDTHGWCQMDRMKMNIRDATNRPMKPSDWCRHHAPRAPQ